MEDFVAGLVFTFLPWCHAEYLVPLCIVNISQQAVKSQGRHQVNFSKYFNSPRCMLSTEPYGAVHQLWPSHHAFNMTQCYHSFKYSLPTLCGNAWAGAFIWETSTHASEVTVTSDFDNGGWARQPQESRTYSCDWSHEMECILIICFHHRWQTSYPVSNSVCHINSTLSLSPGGWLWFAMPEKKLC